MTRSAFFLAAFLLFGSPQHDARTVASALESRYQHSRTLKAVFFQSYSDGKGSLSAESGTVYFSRPGRMRWEYESPEPKLFLVDGTNVWFYVPSDRTASRAKLMKVPTGAPLSRFSPARPIWPSCAAAWKLPIPPPYATSQARTRGDAVLRCIPRESPESQTIHDVLFVIDPNGFLTRIVVREAGDATTEYPFRQLAGRTFPIPEAKFHFEPPPGVAVVNEESLAGTIR